MSVLLPAGGAPADAAVADALAHDWALSAALTAGAMGGSVTLSHHPAAMGGLPAWSVTGVTSTGDSVTFLCSPSLAAGGDSARVGVVLTGTVSRAVSVVIAVAADVWAAGEGAAVAAALASSSAQGSALTVATAAAGVDIAARSKAAAAAIGNALTSIALAATFTDDTAAALDGEGAVARAAAVRSRGVIINGVATADPVILTPPAVGALAAPSGVSAGAATAARSGVDLPALFCFAFVTALVIGLVWRRRHRAAGAAAAIVTAKRKQQLDSMGCSTPTQPRADKHGSLGSKSPKLLPRTPKLSTGSPHSPRTAAALVVSAEARAQAQAVSTENNGGRNTLIMLNPIHGGSLAGASTSERRHSPTRTTAGTAPSPLLLASPARVRSLRSPKSPTLSVDNPLNSPLSSPLKSPLSSPLSSDPTSDTPLARDGADTVTQMLPRGWRTAVSKNGTVYYKHEDGRKTSRRPE